MLATHWNPLSLFLMLDYFSRIYLSGLLMVVIWGISTFLRIMIGSRSVDSANGTVDANTLLKLVKMGRKLHSLYSVGVVLAVGCSANQVFGVWQTYMLRVTDANPFFAIKEAWAVSQLLICLLIVLDTVRWYGCATIERS